MEILVGIISGLITSWGMGGGPFLITILSNFFNTSQHIAQSTNLIFFIPTSLCSVIINSKNKNIQYKLAFQIIIFGIIGAIIGAYLSNKLDKYILKKIFGIMIFIIAIIEICKFFNLNIKNKKRHNKNKQT